MYQAPRYVNSFPSLQIDRKEHFYLQQGIFFPHQDGLDSLHSNVVLDAELVIDTDPKTGVVSYTYSGLYLVQAG